MAGTHELNPFHEYRGIQKLKQNLSGDTLLKMFKMCSHTGSNAEAFKIAFKVKAKKVSASLVSLKGSKNVSNIMLFKRGPCAAKIFCQHFPLNKVRFRSVDHCTQKCGPAASERLYVTSLGEPQQERNDDCRGSERPNHLEGWELPL